MIDAQRVIQAIQGLCDLFVEVESKDVDGWTLGECGEIKEVITRLMILTGALYASCMTDEEMAEAESEDDGEYA